MPQTVGQYLGATKGPVINQLPVNKAYREHAAESTFEKYLRTGRPDETFGEWKARHLEGDKSYCKREGCDWGSRKAKSHAL